MREGGYRWYHETAVSLLIADSVALEATVISSLPDGVHPVTIRRVEGNGQKSTVVYEGRAQRLHKQEYDYESEGYQQLVAAVGVVVPGKTLKIHIVTGGEYDVRRANTGEYIVVSRETGLLHGIGDTLDDVRDYRPDRFIARHIRIK